MRSQETRLSAWSASRRLYAPMGKGHSIQQNHTLAFRISPAKAASHADLPLLSSLDLVVQVLLAKVGSSLSWDTMAASSIE